VTPEPWDVSDAAAEAAERLQGQLDELREQVRTLAEVTFGGEEPRA
jgi:hypothetical protein